ncbi:ISLre2 family transposase, partial [Virgibacillus sp. FSP13]
DAYLESQNRSARKQREVKQVVRMSQFLKQPTRPSIGARQGTVSLYDANSSAIGNLRKILK